MWRRATRRAAIAAHKSAEAIAPDAIKLWNAVAPAAVVAHSSVRAGCPCTPRVRLFHSIRSATASRTSSAPTAAPASFATSAAPASSAQSSTAPKAPDRVSSWLLRELEDAARAQQWATIDVLWERLDELRIIPDSVQQLTPRSAAAKAPAMPPPLGTDLFTLPELRRVFTVLAYTALRTSDVDLLHARLFAVVSAESIDSLELVRSPTTRHALLWSYYLSEQWQAAVSMRDLAQQLGCDAPDRDATGLDVDGFSAPVYAEMMIECLSRCCGEKDAAHLAAKEEAVSKLVSFSWVSESATARAKTQPTTPLAGGSFKLPMMSATTAAAPAASAASSLLAAKPSPLKSSRTTELHSLYNTIDKEEVAAASHGSTHLLADATDADADSLDVSAALRDELCGITRNKLMTLHWADKPYDKACPVQTAVHERAQREAAIARAVMHGLPPPAMTHFPRSLQRPLLHVMLHHYSSTAALSGSVGLLLRCLTVLEPAHGTPDVQIQMAPWSPPDADDAESTTALARASLFVPPPSPSLFASFTWSSQAAKSAANRIDPYSADPEQGRRVRERQTAASVWSSDLIPSVFSRSENSAAMHALARLWASVLDLSLPAQLDQLWKPAQPHVGLSASLLSALKRKLTPPARSRTQQRGKSAQLSLKQALLRMQSPFRNRYDEDLTTSHSSDVAAAEEQPAQQQEAAPIDTLAHRQYKLIRNLLRPGGSQQQDIAPQLSATTMARTGEMA